MKQWVFLFVLGAITPTFSQDNDSIIKAGVVAAEQDTTKQHSVKTATILSLALPGAGQVYNHIAMPKGKKKAYWKVPLIYAGLGATGYFAIKNHQEQKALKQEYINRTEHNVYGDEYLNYDDSGIIQLYQQKLNRRDLLFLGMGLVYLLQVADAAVEAHFVKFDVSDDLSMKIRPAFIPLSYGNPASVGLSLQFTFK
ncbi:hypothetical protein H9Y05_09320 [Crocinitomicaceae bacterium CZZ-1]|uniref:DUF5683 domain-containing protein n=1 Tax=Taishania pollutisoli TaxID=2766479 RepID=A0A8J6U2B6_9FLAO|nr:DUF5683 domain-containing protein [Taishania pollutisoli]MBC9812670.1 hypothetical protein [Taishania pollutisoli]